LLGYNTNRSYNHIVTTDSSPIQVPDRPRTLCDEPLSTWTPTCASGCRAARGETVRLRLDPVGCHLFPADQ